MDTQERNNSLDTQKIINTCEKAITGEIQRIPALSNYICKLIPSDVNGDTLKLNATLVDKE